jgi:type VI secretion system protein ImpF
MSRFDNEVRVTPSVLDRLLDYEPEVTREAASSRAKNLRLLKQTVRRDLEWLLNTRRTPGLPTDLPEVHRSVVAYGLPDFTGKSLRNYDERLLLLTEVEETVHSFEPRLTGVKVELEGDPGAGYAMRFRIDGQLRVEPAPEPVSFDTRLNTSLRMFEVRED